MTTWEFCTYDVWGNETDGYEVNDVYRGAEININCPVTLYNAGTPHEFSSATPGDRQLRRIFRWPAPIEVDGDDVTLYVTDSKTGYPIGELHCTSHASLSPVRKGTVK